MAALLRYLILPVFIVLAAIALVKILKGNYRGNEKLLWIVVVVFVPIIGVILFYLVGKNQNDRFYN